MLRRGCLENLYSLDIETGLFGTDSSSLNYTLDPFDRSSLNVR